MTCKHYFWTAVVIACCGLTRAEVRADYEYAAEATAPATTSATVQTSYTDDKAAAAPAAQSGDCPTCAGGCNCAAAGASCGSCDMPSCIDERKACWMCIAGAEATYLAPHVRSSDSSSGTLIGRDFADIEGKFEVGARIWFGFENDCGNGVRARYWQTEGCENFAGVFTPDNVNYDTVVAFQKLEAYTLDLEYTKRFDRNDWDFLGSLGVRYASMNRNEGFNNYSDNNGYEAFTDANYNYHGTGLTFGLEGRRPFGDSGFALFSSGRASVLWGPSKQGGQSLLENVNATGFQAVTIEEDSETAWILEAQVGVEWSKYLACFNGTAFARFMFEYQHWDINSQTFSLSQNLAGTSLQVNSLSPDVDFYGITFAVGVTR